MLSLTAGLTDVIGFLTLGGLFTAHITGNIVLVSADLVRHHALPPAQTLAIPLFVLASIGAYIVTAGRRPLTQAAITLLVSLQFACLLLTLSIATATVASRHPEAPTSIAAGMLAVAAMAFQNAMLHLIRKDAPATAVMTGNLVAATLAFMTMLTGAAHERSAARGRWQATWPVLAGFIVGCSIGAASVSALADWAWAIPAFCAGLLLVICAAARFSASPSPGMLS